MLERPEAALPAASPWDPALPLRSIPGRYGSTACVSVGSGPPALLLHDFGSTSAVWASVLRRLAGGLASFHAVDLPAHGYSAVPSLEYDPDFFLSWLGDLLARLDLRRVGLIGSGLGGALALAWATNAPHTVDRLVLLGPSIPGVQPSGRWLYWTFWLAHQPRMAALFGPLLPYLLRRSVRESVCDPNVITALETLVREALRRPGVPAAYRSLIRHWHEWLGKRPAFGQLSLPTLLLWGRDDVFYPLRHSRLLQTVMPQAELEIIENCGHLPPLEQPAAVSAALQRFLRIG